MDKNKLQWYLCIGSNIFIIWGKIINAYGSWYEISINVIDVSFISYKTIHIIYFNLFKRQKNIYCCPNIFTFIKKEKKTRYLSTLTFYSYFHSHFYKILIGIKIISLLFMGIVFSIISMHMPTILPFSLRGNLFQYNIFLSVSKFKTNFQDFWTLFNL